MTSDKQTIGRWDRIDFPDFGLKSMKAKVDTGAYTSSLGCSDIHEEEKEGQTVLTFSISDPSKDSGNSKIRIQTNSYKKKKVRTSNNDVEERFIIQTTIIVFSKTYLADFTLTKRDKMKFPVLLGRKFLGKEFVVDPRKTLLSFKKSK